MPKVRAGGQKWKQRAQAAQPDYVAGVSAPRRDWAQATQAAANNYSQGVQQAISEGRYAAGAQRVGTGKWQQRATGVGAQRFAQGVAAAGDAYDRGFAPYRQVIESLTLPDRGPRGDPGNINRVSAIATALHNQKRTLKGGS